MYFLHCALGANSRGRIPGAGEKTGLLAAHCSLTSNWILAPPLPLHFSQRGIPKGGCCPCSVSKFSLSAGETYTYHSVARSTIVSVATAAPRVKPPITPTRRFLLLAAAFVPLAWRPCCREQAATWARVEGCEVVTGPTVTGVISRPL